MSVRITCAKDGPLIVEGLSDLRRIGSGQTYETRDRMALCRCGHSASKPYCDGTHAKVGFNDEKHAQRTPDQRKNYTGRHITIHDNRGICAHAGICTDRLAKVFLYGQEPWIDPDGATPDEIKAVIDACPSGAISYSIDGQEAAASETEPKVLVAPKGPYAIKGPVELVDQTFGAGAKKDCYDLCRCGQSRNKPFCDGSHWNVEFDEQATSET